MDEKPMWELANMDRLDYQRLPWSEKRKLIVRYRGIPIFQPHQLALKIIPERYEAHPFGRLIFAYTEDIAMQKYPCSEVAF